MSNIAALAAALAAGGLSYLAIGKAFGTGAPQPAAKRENRGGKAFKAFSAAVSRALPSPGRPRSTPAPRCAPPA